MARRRASFLDKNIGSAIQAGTQIAEALFQVRQMRWDFALRKAKLEKEERERLGEEAFAREVAAQKRKQKLLDLAEQRRLAAQEEQREELRELNKFMTTQQAGGVTFDPQAVQQARAQESFAPLTAPGATTPRPRAPRGGGGADSDVRIRAFVKAQLGNQVSGLENEIKTKRNRLKLLRDFDLGIDPDTAQGRVEKVGLEAGIKASEQKIKALKAQKAIAEIAPEAALTGARSLLKPTVPIEQSFQTPESQEKQKQLQHLLKSVNPTTGRAYTPREAEQIMLEFHETLSNQPRQ